jgi:hypothetical protein
MVRLNLCINCRTTTTYDAPFPASHILLHLHRYLLTDRNLMVDTLVRMTRLSGEGTDASEALHNSLEALQKLSERRSVQKLMIRHEVSGTAGKKWQLA